MGLIYFNIQFPNAGTKFPAITSMNFLAHTEISPYEPSPRHFFGCIFPDLARRAGVAFRKKQFEDSFHVMPEDFRLGVALHFEADRQFHNSDLFLSGMQMWKEILKPGAPDLKRSFFLHHLVFEMWLDRLIMKEDTQAGMRFYEMLGQLDTRALHSELALLFGADADRLMDVFQQFMTRKFVLAYKDPAQFSEISAGVFAYITGQKQGLLQPSEVEAALELAIPYESKAREEWRSFKSALRL